MTNPFILGLRSLRAFEAAARNLSFTRAAKEISVTTAAISHQIREIEGQVGTTLFIRTSRRIELTPHGRILHQGVSDALSSLQLALTKIENKRSGLELRISSAPSLTAKWLIPRLDYFVAQFPDANVRVDASQVPIDFEKEDVDVAVRFGNGDYPGLSVERLFDETVFPVCSPGLITANKPLREPSDLQFHNLIHLDWQAQGETWPNWGMWLRAAGVTNVNETRGLSFNQTSHALEAALAGQGVVLGESTLVADDLSSGRLIRPFDLALASPRHFAYYLLIRKESLEYPLVSAFRSWILAEAALTKSRLLSEVSQPKMAS